MLGSELVAGPDGGGGGHRIEVIELKQAGGGFVVIPANENFAKVAGSVDDFVGRGSVADDIAEVGDEIERWGGRKAGFQGFEVGVNVAEQQYLQ